ncbi:hypothetical protein ACEPAI_3191 [Sanghuangporus weigelae]
MSSISRSARTYNRRQSAKSASVSTSPSPDHSGTFVSSSRLADEEEPPRKRRTLFSRDADTSGPDGPDVLFHIPKASLSISKPNDRRSNRSPELRMAPSTPTRGSSPEASPTQSGKGKGKAANGSLLTTRQSPSFSATFRAPSPLNASANSNPTTPKKPKDLSRIFETASPHRPHSSEDHVQTTPGKSGITKKMLSRSKTESSIESSPPKVLFDLTPKAQSFVIPREPHISQSENASPSNSPKKQLSRNSSLNSISSGAQHSQREATTSTRTYAGRSRSFLVALPAASVLARKGESSVKQENQLDEDDENYLRDSYAELRKRYGVDNSEGLDADSADTGSFGEGLSLHNPLSSITDLRSKGESRRFRDEVGYLFEGLEPNGALSVRRSSALDIVSNLSDHEFWKKARAAGLIVDIWDRLREAGAGNGDKVLDPILCCFVALASDEPRDILLLANDEDFIETVIRLMIAHATNDPLGSNASNSNLKLTKPETLTLTRLRDIMSAKTSIVHGEYEPSARLLLSRSLSAVPSLAIPHLSVILESVIGDLTCLCNRLAAYRSGLALFNEASGSGSGHEKLCFGHIYNCLAILDFYLIKADSSEEAQNLSKEELRNRYRTMPSGLIALIVISDVLSRSKSTGALRTQATRCSELAFRILINLTNGDPIWTDAVVADPFTLPTIIRLITDAHRSLLVSSTKKRALDSATQDVATSAMDRLCLALALLTNLLQERDNLAYSLQNMMLDSLCEGRRTCLVGCRCANSISAVSGLVNIYISFLKDEDDDMVPDFHFLRGHLAVLIGLLLLQLHNPGVSSLLVPSGASTPSPTASAPHHPSRSSASPSERHTTHSTFHEILDSLPGPSGSSGLKEKLISLINNIDAFSQLYASLTSRISSNADTRNGADSGDCREETGGNRNRDSVIDSQRQAERNDSSKSATAGSDVVAGVAASLRALRDEFY